MSYSPGPGWAHLVDLVLPRRCVGCAGPGAGLCQPCRASRPSVRFLPGVGMVHSGAGYAGAIGTAIVHFKDRDRRDLLGPLASLLGASLASLLAGSAAGLDPGRGLLVVPVPSSRRAARDRGGDHMRRLARRAVRPLGLDYAALLQVRRAVVDAAGLTARERRDNVGGAFGIRPRPGWSRSGCAPAADGRLILLVDDIVTTGATLTEAARALIDGGYRVGGAAVIAATARGSPQRS